MPEDERHDGAGLVATGLACLEAGDRDGALRHFRAALSRAPGDPEAVHGLACVARAAGRPDLAIGLAGKAIATLPAAHFHITLGRALQERGHLEEARAALSVATLREPRDPRAHAALADVLEAQGAETQAEASLRRAIALRPRDPVLMLNLAHLRIRGGDRLGGLALARQAVALAPDRVESLGALATLLAGAGRAEEAEAVFRDIVRLRPDDAAAWANHGAALFALNRHEVARTALEHAARLAPEVAETQNNLGLVLMALGHLPEAHAALAAARALNPEDSRIAVNVATVLAELSRTGEAEELCRAVLARADAGTDLDAARARFNLGTLLLARGAGAEGWRCLEARSRLIPLADNFRGRDIPEWDGSVVESGAVLLYAEQGLGDTIQFLRYLPQAVRRTQLVLDIPASLHRLVRTLPDPDGTVWSRCRLLPPGAEPSADIVARCGLMSLPDRLEIPDVPAFSPYLLPVPAGRASDSSGVSRVGLCWAGNPSYRFDHRRSVPLGTLAPLGDVVGVSFVSLDHGDTGGTIGNDVPFALEWPPQGDLLTTARTIAGLDLVITVDTAIAHLAGAMGRPVWLLNRFGGDWRWSVHFDTPTPSPWGDRGSRWYPSLHQFRQMRPEPPDRAWDEPVTRMRDALARWRDLESEGPG
ncbi:tetratricopeptide repeat protein [Gluconacetobacter tumulisoli]|uniref:Tetratricopeptide repeat protein n=1 Tax=Gluconacetobacter tumulisoli TaxID=1286189 RepID=A0A7W4K6C8_9PROT|nr:tetratricopeptide repeat protein [Gluconacetobacter tumulisoli]MBB2201166.1 tetratricopeptide repeat protein [Gluconacetobacter tumulisoli]